MHAQPGDRSCSNPAIGGNHFGPVMVYMAKVDDAKSASGSSASWFKVDEFGYDAGSKTWGTDKLNSNCGKRSFKIPSKIPAGDYLVRAEAIALHTAGQSGGAQFYMSCYVSFQYPILSWFHTLRCICSFLFMLPR
jgi:cellulase